MKKAKFAVIFTSQLVTADPSYRAASEKMMQMVSTMPGYLGVDSVRDESGIGITISYWESLESIRAWGQNPTHRAIQEKGKDTWYSTYTIRIAKIEEERFWPQTK